MGKLTILGVLLCLGFLAFSPNYLHADQVNSMDLVYLTEDYPPHNFVKNGRIVGVSVEILKLIWKELGLSNTVADIEVVPWARGMHRIMREPNIVLFGMGYSDDRAKQVNWVGPYYSHTLGLIAKRNRNISLKNLEEAQHLIIGAVREDIGHHFLVENGFPKNKLELSNNQDSLFMKLKVDRFDMISYMTDSAYKGMAESGLNQDEYVTVLSLKVFQSGFGFSKQIPPMILADFQRALDALIERGEVQAILKKYKLN